MLELLKNLEDSYPHLTLGDMITLHQSLDREICRQLAVAPISDTLDLRSANIRREVYSYEQNSDDNI
jgi:hypothetical protein